jgi:hypothetical protein
VRETKEELAERGLKFFNWYVCVISHLQPETSKILLILHWETLKLNFNIISNLMKIYYQPIWYIRFHPTQKWYFLHSKTVFPDHLKKKQFFRKLPFISFSPWFPQSKTNNQYVWLFPKGRSSLKFIEFQHFTNLTRYRHIADCVLINWAALEIVTELYCDHRCWK